MDWFTVIILVHIIGTVLGAGGATFAEINLIRALRDGEVSPDESEIMKGAYAVLHFGFFLLVLSGFAFLLYFRLADETEFLYSPEFWAKLTVIGVLLVNAVLLQTRKINLVLGSAISITSWYTALALGVLSEMDYPYLGTLVVYVFAVLSAFFILRIVHKRFCHPRQSNAKTS